MFSPQNLFKPATTSGAGSTAPRLEFFDTVASRDASPIVWGTKDIVLINADGVNSGAYVYEGSWTKLTSFKLQFAIVADIAARDAINTDFIANGLTQIYVTATKQLFVRLNNAWEIVSGVKINNITVDDEAGLLGLTNLEPLTLIWRKDTYQLYSWNGGSENVIGSYDLIDWADYIVTYPELIKFISPQFSPYDTTKAYLKDSVIHYNTGTGLQFYRANTNVGVINNKGEVTTPAGAFNGTNWEILNFAESALKLKGNFDASTGKIDGNVDLPTANASNKGHLYLVSVAGSTMTNVDTPVGFEIASVGDWIINTTGSAWTYFDIQTTINNTLTSTDPSEALAAPQGKILNEKIIPLEAATYQPKTGWVSGGLLGKTLPNSANINMTTPCVIRVVDFPSNDVTELTIAAINNIPTGMTAGQEKYLYINISGTVGSYTTSFEWIADPTILQDSQKRVRIGRVWMDNVGNVSGYGDYVIPAYGTSQPFDEAMKLGSSVKVGTGNTYSLHSTEAALAKTEGQDWRYYVWAKITPENPSSGLDAALTRIPYYDMCRQGTADFTEATDIPTDQWDNGGTLEALPNNKYAVAVVAFFPFSNLTAICYPQSYENSMAEAESNFDPLTFLYSPHITGTTIIKGFLIYVKGATGADFANPAKVKFIPKNYVPSLGGSGGGTTLPSLKSSTIHQGAGNLAVTEVLHNKTEIHLEDNTSTLTFNANDFGTDDFTCLIVNTVDDAASVTFSNWQGVFDRSGSGVIDLKASSYTLPANSSVIVTMTLNATNKYLNFHFTKTALPAAHLRTHATLPAGTTWEKSSEIWVIGGIGSSANVNQIPMFADNITDARVQGRLIYSQLAGRFGGTENDGTWDIATMQTMDDFPTTHMGTAGRPNLVLDDGSDMGGEPTISSEHFKIVFASNHDTNNPIYYQMHIYLGWTTFLKIQGASGSTWSTGWNDNYVSTFEPAAGVSISTNDAKNGLTGTADLVLIYPVYTPI